MASNHAITIAIHRQSTPKKRPIQMPLGRAS